MASFLYQSVVVSFYWSIYHSVLILFYCSIHRYIVLSVSCISLLFLSLFLHVCPLNVLMFACQNLSSLPDSMYLFTVCAAYGKACLLWLVLRYADGGSDCLHRNQTSGPVTGNHYTCQFSMMFEI